MLIDPPRRRTGRRLAVLVAAVGLGVVGCGSPAGSAAGAAPTATAPASAASVPCTEVNPTVIPRGANPLVTPTGPVPPPTVIPRGANPPVLPTGPVPAPTVIPRGANPPVTPTCSPAGG
jgi:hypothetical protein